MDLLGILFFLLALLGFVQAEDDQAKEDLSELGMEPAEVKERLRVVAHLMDVNKDGFVTEEEILKWLENMKNKVISRTVKLEMGVLDADGDGEVTMDEFLRVYDEDEYGAGSAERFKLVDKDKNGVLSLNEVALLIHPFDDEEVVKAEVKEILNAHDLNKDGAISIDEFLKQDTGSGEFSEAEKKSLHSEFDQTDTNKDGLIDAAEIRVVMLSSTQTEHPPAKEVVDKLLSAIGVTGDNRRVSVDQIVEAYDLWAVSDVTDLGELLRYPQDYDVYNMPPRNSTNCVGDDCDPVRDEL